MTVISPLAASDRSEWERLWADYLVFYRSELPESVTDDVFARLVAGDGLHGAIARDDAGRAVGFVHWLFHPSTWSTRGYCYLEDLFVAPGERGAGLGAALIAHVGDAARSAGAEKVYWLTEESNETARRLYDRVATRTGFIHYELAD
ncbi:GNAT family N-acetyltransferase [Microbacterium paulum]|nr:GNAT family N-acetyltransferase [Microbacterium sp.]